MSALLFFAAVRRSQVTLHSFSAPVPVCSDLLPNTDAPLKSPAPHARMLGPRSSAANAALNRVLHLDPTALWYLRKNGPVSSTVGPGWALLETGLAAIATFGPSKVVVFCFAIARFSSSALPDLVYSIESAAMWALCPCLHHNSGRLAVDSPQSFILLLLRCVNELPLLVRPGPGSFRQLHSIYKGGIVPPSSPKRAPAKGGSLSFGPSSFDGCFAFTCGRVPALEGEQTRHLKFCALLPIRLSFLRFAIGRAERAPCRALADCGRIPSAFPFCGVEGGCKSHRSKW